MRSEEIGQRKPPFKIRNISRARFFPLVPERQRGAGPVDQPQSGAQAGQEAHERPALGGPSLRVSINSASTLRWSQPCQRAAGGGCLGNTPSRRRLQGL